MAKDLKKKELKKSIEFLKDKGLINTETAIVLLCRIIGYFASKQETNQSNITADVDMSICERCNQSNDND
jgi:hypothetical protein